MFEGRPVFYSECMTRAELLSFLKKNKIPLSGGRVLTYEILTPYNTKGDLLGREELNISSLFTKKQSIYLYYRKSRPKNLKGKFKLRKK